MSTEDTTTRKSTTTKARRPVAAAALACLAVAAALLVVGVAIGRGTVPSTPEAAAQPGPEATAAPPGAPDAATPAPSPAGGATPAAAPKTPESYGRSGLAGQYARKLGHGSMSEACAAGIDWTCGVQKIEPGSYNTPGQRVVSTLIVPFDGDAAAQEWLDLSPESVTSIEIRYVGGFLAQEVGTAERETTEDAQL